MSATANNRMTALEEHLHSQKMAKQRAERKLRQPVKRGLGSIVNYLEHTAEKVTCKKCLKIKEKESERD